jgi:hypothetical protein
MSVLITLTMQVMKKFSGYGRYITPAGITALKNHKYKPGHYTPMDNAMQPFWNWFVSLIPLVSPTPSTLSKASKQTGRQATCLSRLKTCILTVRLY